MSADPGNPLIALEPHRLTALLGIRELALLYPDGSLAFGERAFVAGPCEVFRDALGRVVVETHADVELEPCSS